MKLKQDLPSYVEHEFKLELILQVYGFLEPHIIPLSEAQVKLLFEMQVVTFTRLI